MKRQMSFQNLSCIILKFPVSNSPLFTVSGYPLAFHILDYFGSREDKEANIPNKHQQRGSINPYYNCWEHRSHPMHLLELKWVICLNQTTGPASLDNRLKMIQQLLVFRLHCVETSLGDILSVLKWQRKIWYNIRYKAFQVTGSQKKTNVHPRWTFGSGWEQGSSNTFDGLWASKPSEALGSDGRRDVSAWFTRKGVRRALDLIFVRRVSLCHVKFRECTVAAASCRDQFLNILAHLASRRSKAT